MIYCIFFCTQYKPNTDLPNDFHIYFDVLADMLDNSEPPEERRKKFYEQLYGWIKNLSRLNREQPVIRSAIDLLSRHMNLFENLLYPDCEYWHNFLRRLSRKTTASGAYGRRALKKFYRVMGHILTEKNSEDARNLLLVNKILCKMSKRLYRIYHFLLFFQFIK